MPLLADRNFASYALWRTATATGADLLWRPKIGLRPERVQTLADDSGSARIRLSTDKRAEPITVRVIDYTIDDGRENPEHYRLFTTILDPAQASALELAAAYVQRWDIELSPSRNSRPTNAAPHRAQIEVPRAGAAGDLGTSVVPLRDPIADGQGRRPRRARPRPHQLHRRTTNHPPIHRPAGRLPPEHPDAADHHWRAFLHRLLNRLNRLNPARRTRAATPGHQDAKCPDGVKRAAHATWPQPHPPDLHAPAPN